MAYVVTTSQDERHKALWETGGLLLFACAVLSEALWKLFIAFAARFSARPFV
jgi:hypothetical protein